MSTRTGTQPTHRFNGILNVNKPSGLTSHDVVSRLRRITGQRRVGHAGTLDPTATGVLLLCLGQATRVAEYLQARDKVYRARLRLGISTDTYDSEGQIVDQRDTGHITHSAVQRALGEMVGPLDQVPPMYSAIKHQGTPLYRLARRGQTVERKPRRVVIHTLELLEWDPPYLEAKIHCSKGTYIRSLAHDLGQRLGCGAHLAELTRLASGRFQLSDALVLEELEHAAEQGKLERLLLPIDAALQDYPAVTVDDDLAKSILFGQRVRLPDAPQATLLRAYGRDEKLLALLRLRNDGAWQPHKVFAVQQR
jgi:tRNA pseudouridine55 synthase